MRNGILAVLGAGIVLGGAGLIGLGGDKGPGDVGQVDGGVEPVAVEADAHVVVLPGDCPVSVGPTQEAARCKHVHQLPGRCVCWTSQAAGTVDGEITDPATLPAASRVRLVACGKAGQPTRVRWEADSGEPAVGCVVAARPLVDVTLGDAETDLVTQLRAACAPCAVTGTSWGRCPACLVEAGGCAEACR